MWTALIVFIDKYSPLVTLHLPASITSSLSIVVGLLLVFRNQRSYYRFWSGTEHLTTINACVRNLARSFLTCCYAAGKPEASASEFAETEDAVRVLLAIVYAVKNTLRFEWGTSVGAPDLEEGSGMLRPELKALLPSNCHRALEYEGLGMPLQLSIAVEAYIKRAHDRGWVHSPQASQLSVQLNTLVAAYSALETIRLTPIPVAYLIHTQQVLALFGCVLPFAFVDEFGWWSIPMVALVNFTLYGIEGIAGQLEDPFGYDRNDIKMDDIVEDVRVEIEVLLQEWRMRGPMFAVIFERQGFEASNNLM